MVFPCQLTSEISNFSKIISQSGVLLMGKFNKKKLGPDRDLLKKTVTHPYITPQKLHNRSSEAKNSNRDEYLNPCGSSK